MNGDVIMEMDKHPMPASPLPWSVDVDRADKGDFIAKAADGTITLLSRVEPNPTFMAYIVKTQQDYRYAVWACNAAPALRAEVEWLRAALAELITAADLNTNMSGIVLIEALSVARAALESRKP